MAAEIAPLGESSGGPITLSRAQFSLGAMFVFWLQISPLFIGLMILRIRILHQALGLAMELNILFPCTAIYSGILAARAEIRRLRNAEKPPGRSLLPAIRTAGFCGALFWSLAFCPAQFAQLLEHHGVLAMLPALWKSWSLFDALEVLRKTAECLAPLAFIVGFSVLAGFFVGAAGGVVVGFVIEFRKRRGLIASPA